MNETRLATRHEGHWKKRDGVAGFHVVSPDVQPPNLF